jgi:RNA polymerase sigma-70 factor, ECF subfamily
MVLNKDIESKTDEEIVILVLENQDFYAYLISRYEEKLSRYIRRISSFPPEDVEDILQEVFVKAYQNLKSFNPQMKFSSWIYRITHNQVISHWRKIKGRPNVISAEENNEWLESMPDSQDIERELNIKFDAEKIRRIIDGMDEKYREVLILRYFEGKDYSEISDILEKPMGTVATLINRAKKNFEKVLRENGTNNLNYHTQ